MKIDPLRNARQKKACRLWLAAKMVGTIVAVTGFGKSRIGILLIKHLKKLALQSDRELVVLIVVPTTYLKNQWVEIVEKNGWTHVQVKTIHMAIKKVHKCHLLLVDEIHMLAAPTFRKVFKMVHYQFFLGLTATLEDERKNNIIKKHAPVVDEITLAQCRKHGWVAEYVIYNLGIEMDKDKRRIYNAITIEFNRIFARFHHEYKLIQACLAKGERGKKARTSIAEERMRRKKPIERKSLKEETSFVFLDAQKAQKLTQQRLQLLHNYTPKLDVAVRICQKFEDRKIICFSQSIAAADYINSNLGDPCVAYHSKLQGRTVGIRKGTTRKMSAKEMKEQAVKNFASDSKWPHVLSTAKALDMGANIPSIDMGIITSGTSRALQAIQRYGRTLRKTDDGRSVIIVEIYVLDTQDYKWLKKRQRDVPNISIKTIRSIDQIK
jgi:RNA polymerase primary sigma factor